VRISRRVGAAGVGVGVALGVSGVIGAAVAVPAASADAATSTTYNSTASAEAGFVQAGGVQVPVPDNSVRATDSSGPQNGSLGLSTVENALNSVPAIGPALESAMKSADPSGANLVTESATASPDGTSSACAGFLTGGCSDGTAAPITLDLSLGTLLGLVPGGTSGATGASGTSNSGNSPASAPSSDSPGSSASGTGTGTGSGGSGGAGISGGGLGNAVKKGLQQLIPTQAPSGLTTSATRLSSTGQAESGSAAAPDADYQIVLTISGPEAACTAGPPGSTASNFTATQNLAAVTLDIRNSDGTSVLPGGKPISLATGSALSQLPLSSLSSNSALSTLTSSLTSVLQQSPIDVTIDPGSTTGAGSGPGTSATAGELGLSIGGTQVLDVTGAKAVCGPNNAAAAAVTKPATKTSTETPLGGGIQTDEGYYAPPSSDDAVWIGLMAGGAALAAGAGGFSFWRRRPHRS
jgi:hypothetical protein